MIDQREAQSLQVVFTHCIKQVAEDRNQVMNVLNFERHLLEKIYSNKPDSELLPGEPDEVPQGD